MKSISKISLMTLFSGLLLFTSCNKYEEGPIFSIRERNARVANQWVIEKATSEGEDITDQFDTYELELGKDGDAMIEAEFTFFGENYKTVTDGTWEFMNEDENISFDFEDDSFDAVYQIIELRENHMMLRQIGEDLELDLEGK